LLTAVHIAGIVAWSPSGSGMPSPQWCDSAALLHQQAGCAGPPAEGAEQNSSSWREPSTSAEEQLRFIGHYSEAPPSGENETDASVLVAGSGSTCEVSKPKLSRCAVGGDATFGEDFASVLTVELRRLCCRLNEVYIAQLANVSVANDRLLKENAELRTRIQRSAFTEFCTDCGNVPGDEWTHKLSGGGEAKQVITSPRSSRNNLRMPHIPREDGPRSEKPGFGLAEQSVRTVLGRAESDANSVGGECGVEQMQSSESCIRQESKNTCKSSIVDRVRLRLGLPSEDAMVTGAKLHHAASNLGLTKYSARALEHLVHHINTVLAAEQAVSSTVRPQLSWIRKRFQTTVNLERDYSGSVISLMDFVGVLESTQLQERFGAEAALQLMAIREILLSPDTNRLIADIMRVHLDDLATPPPAKWGAIVIMEPIVCLAIVANGAMIGIQTDANLEAWPGWDVTEACFALFFTLEAVIRIRISGCAEHFCGPDWRWNVFDFGIVVLSVVDVVLALLSDSSAVQSLTTLRFLRLTRLTRLIRILRLKFMKELQLMVKGMLSGFCTLVWAFVLLFFVIYVIAVFLTTTIGRHRNSVVHDQGLFSTVPRSMFTAFRCFLGDCATEEGFPIAKLLLDAHGALFVVGYVISSLVVTFGIFNVIMAIYVETTMDAAKQQESNDAKVRDQEALRVAHITKQLLKTFSAAQRMQENGGLAKCARRSGLGSMLKDFGDEDIDLETTISKELFLLVVQDRKVQNLMDDLDVPPDRAHLFDIIDADHSGSLELIELVQGLLKVRGEARKSDIIAALLAVHAVQDMLRELETQVLTKQDKIMDHLGISLPEPKTTGLQSRTASFASHLSSD